MGNRTGETVLNSNQDQAPQQPTAASFRADSAYRGFKHWFVSYAFLPCYRTRPAGGGPLLDRQGLLPPSLVGRYSHDYYESSATPRRQQRTVRLPQAEGLAGTAGALPTFTHRPVGRVGDQLYPGGIATRYRNTARGLDRPNRNRSAETIPSNNRDRAPQQPIAASFGAAVLYRGF